MTALKQSFRAAAYGSKLINIPKPENLILNLYYSFTLSPPEDGQFQFPNFDGGVDKYNRLINNCTSCHIKMDVEYSVSGRFHFHGTIAVKDPIAFYLVDLPELKLYGQIDMQTMGNPMDWDLYCRKLQIQNDGLAIWRLTQSPYNLQLHYDNRQTDWHDNSCKTITVKGNKKRQERLSKIISL